MQSLMSFISGQPSVQGEEGEVPNQSNEMVEFGWNMIKVNARLSQVSTYFDLDLSMNHELIYFLQ